MVVQDSREKYAIHYLLNQDIMKFRFLIICTGLICFLMAGMAQNQDTMLTLEGAVHMGMETNLRIRAANKELMVAKGRAISVLGIEDPFLSGQWSEIPAGSAFNAYGERDLSITQSIDFPTNYIYKKKLGNLDRRREQLIYENTRLVIRTEIEKAYYEVLAKRDQLAIVAQHIDLAREFLDKAEARFNAGKAAYLEVARAQLALANVENEKSAAVSDFQTAKANLKALLDLPEEVRFLPADSLLYKPVNPDLESLTEQAMQNHPQLLAVKLSQEMAREDLRLAKGSYLPSIEGSVFSQQIGGERFHGAGVGLSIPLWFPVNQRGKVIQGQGNLDAAIYRSQDAAILLRRDIQNAWSRVISAQQQVEKYRNNLLKKAQDLYTMTLRSYEEGKADYLKVLDAQESMIMINKNFIDALAGYKIMVAELEAASNQMIDQ